MSSPQDAEASGASVPDLEAGQLLHTSSSVYAMLNFVGEGSFGKVALWHNVEQDETVAVKILKKVASQYVDNEVAALEVLNELNPDLINVVRFHERVEFMQHTCLVFEQLDISLFQLVQQQAWRPLPLHQIRPIATQMLVALDALKELGVVHRDIKPDNIMLVRADARPLTVKLIDFGLTVSSSELRLGETFQATGYRAPEVSLGLRCSEALDMWGLGCVLAFLYLADHLFPINCSYQAMKFLVDVFGQPEDHLLLAGLYSLFFFTEERTANTFSWRLLTPAEFTAVNNEAPKERRSFFSVPRSLDDLVNIRPHWGAAELEDRRALVDLLKRMLHLDEGQRLTPTQALDHPFITMSHLIRVPNSSAYMTTSLSWVTKAETTEDRVKPPRRSSTQELPTMASELPPSSRDSEDSQSSPELVPERHVSLCSTFTVTTETTGSLPPSLGSLESLHLSSLFGASEDSEDLGRDDVVPSGTSQPDGPSTAPISRLRRAGRRVRRVFRRIHTLLCCCFRPPVED